MSKVYIVQNYQTKNEHTGIYESRYDLEPAKRWGELVFLLTPKAKPFNSKMIIAELKQKLADYTSEDYILPVGNPCLIAMAVSCAVENNGQVNLLQWVKANNSHVPIVCDFFS